MAPKKNPCKKQFRAQLAAPVVDLCSFQAPKNRPEVEPHEYWRLASKNDPQNATKFISDAPPQSFGDESASPKLCGGASKTISVAFRGSFFGAKLQ